MPILTGVLFFEMPAIFFFSSCYTWVIHWVSKGEKNEITLLDG